MSMKSMSKNMARERKVLLTTSAVQARKVMNREY